MKEKVKVKVTQSCPPLCNPAGIQIAKEEVQLSWSADHMILNVQNPKNSTKKLLERSKKPIRT